MATQQAYPVHLSDYMEFTVAATLGVPFAIITAVRVQDVSTGEWYNWNAGSWDKTPKCHPGAGNLYVAFWAINQGAYFSAFVLEIRDDTGKLLMNKTWGAGYLEGIGIEVTVDMPARNYGIKLTVVP